MKFRVEKEKKKNKVDIPNNKVLILSDYRKDPWANYRVHGNNSKGFPKEEIDERFNKLMKAISNKKNKKYL